MPNPKPKLCKTPEAAAALKELFIKNKVTHETLMQCLPNAEGSKSTISKATAEKYLAHPETIPDYCAVGVERALNHGVYVISSQPLMDIDRVLEHAGSVAVNVPGLALSPYKGTVLDNPENDTQIEPLQPYNAPHGLLGLIYAYCSVSDRDRQTLLLMAEHLLDTAEANKEYRTPDEGREAVVAAILGQPFGYTLGEALEHFNEYSSKQDVVLMQNRADEFLQELPSLDVKMVQRVAEVTNDHALTFARQRAVYDPMERYDFCTDDEGNRIPE